MGVEYGLYCRANKLFLWLGKRCGDRYQRDSVLIDNFASTWCLGQDMEMLADTGNYPIDGEDGWVEMWPTVWPGRKSDPDDPVESFPGNDSPRTLQDSMKHVVSAWTLDEVSGLRKDRVQDKDLGSMDGIIDDVVHLSKVLVRPEEITADWNNGQGRPYEDWALVHTWETSKEYGVSIRLDDGPMPDVIVEG